MTQRWLVIVLCVAGLSGCVLPRFQPTLPEVQEPRITANSLITPDNTALPLRQWLPKNGKPKALIIALHGFNDYSNAFAMPGEYLAGQGIAVLAYDQRGFGQNPQRGIWGGHENLERDLAAAVSAAKQRYPQVPLYIMGDSMGAAVAIAAMTSNGFPLASVKGVVLVAPALWGGETLSPMYRFLLWTAAHHLPGWEMTGRGLKILASDNMPMLQALGRDPLIIKQTRVDAIYGMVQLMDKAQESIPTLRPPILFLYGQHDQVIPAGAIWAAMRKMPPHFTFVHYQQGWHMLLRDLQAQRVWQDVAAWVSNPAAPLPSGETVTPAEFLKQKQWSAAQKNGK